MWQSAQILNGQLNKFLKSEYTHALSSQIRKQNIFRSEKMPSFPSQSTPPFHSKIDTILTSITTDQQLAWPELNSELMESSLCSYILLLLLL